MTDTIAVSSIAAVNTNVVGLFIILIIIETYIKVFYLNSCKHQTRKKALNVRVLALNPSLIRVLHIPKK